MAKRTYFKDPSGNTVIPVSDDSFYTDLLSVSNDVADVYLSFYSDASGDTPVTPTAGTVSAWGEYESGFWLEAVGDKVLAANVSPPDAAYTPQTMNGCTVRARVDLLGVTGAAYFRGYVFKRS